MTKILVTGSTGKIGRQLVAQLDGADVRALTRSPVTAGLPGNVEAVAGDLATVEGLEAALDGVDKVFLLWPLFSTGSAAEVVDLIARHARHVVFLSSAGVTDDGENTIFHAEIERLIEQSGLQWTFLRAGGFATNALDWAEQIRTGGEVHWPYGNAVRVLIHEADIAAVAARTLTEDGHFGRKYVLTGADQISQADQVRAIGTAIGADLRWREMDPGTAREYLMSTWGDSSFVSGALEHWASLEKHPEEANGTVERITGVPARTFGEWARDHADDFRPLATG